MSHIQNFWSSKLVSLVELVQEPRWKFQQIKLSSVWADKTITCLKLVPFLSLRFISLFCSHYSHIWRNYLLYFPFRRATPWIKDEGAIGVCRAVEPSACIYAYPGCVIQLIPKILSLKKKFFFSIPPFLSLYFPCAQEWCHILTLYAQCCVYSETRLLNMPKSYFFSNYFTIFIYACGYLAS